MNKEEKVAKLKYPLEYFKRRSVVIKLLNGDVKKGVIFSNSPATINLLTNIGTDDKPEKGILKIHKKEVCYVEENIKKNIHKKYKKRKKQQD